MKLQLRKEIEDEHLLVGGSPAWYWGVGYRNPWKRSVVFYIIPLNWMVWIGRQLLWRLRFPPADYGTKLYNAGYDKGAQDERRAMLAEQIKPPID